MKRVLGTLVSSALVAVMVPATAAGAPAQEGGEPAAFILVDVESGAILEGKNIHEPLPVASAVKLMTALTVAQRIPNEDRVATTPLAADAPAPVLGMREGTTWASEDLVQAMLLSSANDAAYALAEGAAGSLEKFIADMDRVGKLMGLEDSTFADPAGVDDASAYRGTGSVMSAYDLAITGVNVLGATELAEITKLKDYRVITPDGEETELQENVNDFALFYPDATGLMAGFTAKAGAVQVASAKRDGRHLVAVVLNAENAVFAAAALLDRGFDTKNPEGTGDFLPETRITTIQARLVALAGIPRPLGAPAIPASGAKGPNAPVSEGPEPLPARPAVEDEGGGGGGGFPFLLVLAMFMAAGLVIAAVLRGQKVQQERVHRRARERYLAEARRRGTIDVLDPEVSADPADVRIVRR